MKLFKYLFYFITVLYIIGAIFLYFAQASLLFIPDSLPEDYTYRKGVEQKLQVADGINISCYWNKLDNPKGVILYFHGNKGSIRRCIRQSEMMEDLGYDIFMPDYRGYGKSEGKLLSDDQFYADAQIVYDFLKEKYREENIVIAGYSMGSGPASYLAGTNKPKELFLISPFKSIVDLKNRYLPIVPNFLIKFQFPNWQYIEQVDCPITVFYTKEDRVVLPNSTLALCEHSEHETLIELENTSHRGAIFHRRWRQELEHRLDK